MTDVRTAAQAIRSASGPEPGFVTVRSLSKAYRPGTQTISVLRELDLEVARGEMIAIVGASGVG